MGGCTPGEAEARPELWKKIRTELIEAIGEDWVAKCDLHAGMGGDKHLCRPLGRD